MTRNENGGEMALADLRLCFSQYGINRFSHDEACLRVGQVTTQQYRERIINPSNVTVSTCSIPTNDFM